MSPPSALSAVAAPALRPRAPVPALPSTADLFASGGDTRLTLDPRRGTNKYGCRPFPDPTLLAFGSSTASIVSGPGFAAADRLRGRLLRQAMIEPPDVTYARELQRLRGELVRLCGLSGLGADIVFAASGTDLHLIAGQSAAACGQRLCAIAVEPAETGSGVPAALAGRHFSTATALGQSVVDGVRLAGAEAVEVVSVPARDPAGILRAGDDVSRDIAVLADAAVAEGRRVLVVVADVSKTGFLSPGLDGVLALQRRHAGSLDILIDGCQFRLAPATLRAYLQCGCMVAVTGSKFVTGPAFAGALLVPPVVAERLKRRPLPRDLAAYSARGEWPDGWAAAGRLPDAANYGLLLRWQAALAELAAFQALPLDDVAAFVTGFGRAVQTRFAADPHFEALPAPPLDRRAIGAPASWDGLPTIFPFLLRRDGGSRWLSPPETERVYKRLAAQRCQVGQPVAGGRRGGLAVHALRLCLSARLIVRAVAAGHADEVIADALSVLDKAALIVDTI